MHTHGRNVGDAAIVGAATAATLGIASGAAQRSIALALAGSVVGLAAGALIGALVALAAAPAGRGTGGWLDRKPARILVVGVTVGGGGGAVAGTITGAVTYLPTTAFAAVEGAALGLLLATPVLVEAVVVGSLPRRRRR